MHKKQLSKFCILLKDANNGIETYRVPEKLFKIIRENLQIHRSEPPLPIPVKCIETGERFSSARAASDWLHKIGIKTTYTSIARIKNACKKHNIVYGYHWEFIKCCHN